MKKINMMVAAIVCCMVVQAQSIEENLKAYNDTVVAISNQIVKCEKEIANLSANTNMDAQTKAALLPAENNKLQTLIQRLTVAKETAKKANEELKVIQGFTTEKVVDVPTMDLSTISSDDANYLVKLRYDKGQKLYHSKWFSTKDDVLNHSVLRGISSEKNTNVKAALLFQYFSEQL